MPRDSVVRLQQAVGAFAARHRALEDKERVLDPLGYAVVPVSPRSAAPGGRRAPRRRGRR
jgi:hypothetical protein